MYLLLTTTDIFFETLEVFDNLNFSNTWCVVMLMMKMKKFLILT